MGKPRSQSQVSVREDPQEIQLDGHKEMRKVWEPSVDEIEAEILHIVPEDN